MGTSQLRHDSTIASRRWTRVLVLGTPVLLVAGVVLFGKPLFETNDDAAIAMVGSGFGIATAPDPHFLFSHVGYGLILRLATALVGPLAHGYVTLAALGLAVGLFVRALCGPGRHAVIGAVLLIAATAVFLRPLLEPQFTATAALLFGAAISCWCRSIHDGTRSPVLSVAIYAALVLGFLIRPSAGYLGIVVIGPAVLWLAWFGPASNRPAYRRLLAMLGAIAVLCYAADAAAYAISPQWQDALAYGRVQSLFVDFFRVPWSPDAPEFRKVGWSANDYATFMAWFSNSEIFSFEAISYLASKSQAPLINLSGVPAWFAVAWKLPSIRALIIIQILLCALLPRYRVVAALLLTGCVLATVIAGLSGRPPASRVLYSSACIAVLCTLPFLLALETAPRRRALASFAVVAIVALYSGSATIEAHSQRVRAAEAYRATLAGAKPFFSGKVVAWGDALAVEFLVTPTAVYSPFPDATMFPIGGFSRTPAARGTLDHMGIADLSSALCTEPDVHLIATQANVDKLTTFCLEHLHVQPAYDLVFDNRRTRIYRSRTP